MAAEIANRQLASIATELESEGVAWAEFLSDQAIPHIDLTDPFARIDWEHFVRVLDAADQRWSKEHLADIAYRSLFSKEVASFSDGITIQCENLDEMMEYLFGAGGAFGSVVPCVTYHLDQPNKRHWLVTMRMNQGYQLAQAHCHYGIGILRALPVLMFHRQAQVRLTIDGDKAHYDVRVRGFRPFAYLQLRYARSKANRGLAERASETFTELMVRQGLLQAEAERRVQVEAELSHLEKLDALGRLTGSVAHDFNNLLTVIQGQLELLGLEATQPQSVERIHIAARAADRGAKLTKQLLAFGRRAALQPENTDVNMVIEEMLPIFASTFENLIDVSTNLHTTLWRTLVDRSQLETALLNLAINARDAMPAGGTVNLNTYNVYIDAEAAARAGDIAPGRYAVVEVADTGIGIDPDILEHVFEPFFSTKKPGMGTGLGLSMVWGFLQQSGGSARIHSKPDCGTTVQLYLPQSSDGGQVNPIAPTQQPADTADPDVHILVVEDETGVREVVTDMLEQLGYQVTAVGDADAARDALNTTKGYALLLTDVVLPAGQYGPDIARAAQALIPGLPVVYMSGYPEPGKDNRGALASSDTLISKPFSFTELASTITQALGREEESANKPAPAR